MARPSFSQRSALRVYSIRNHSCDKNRKILVRKEKETVINKHLDNGKENGNLRLQNRKFLSLKLNSARFAWRTVYVFVAFLSLPRGKKSFTMYRLRKLTVREEKTLLCLGIWDSSYRITFIGNKKWLVLKETLQSRDFSIMEHIWGIDLHLSYLN